MVSSKILIKKRSNRKLYDYNKSENTTLVNIVESYDISEIKVEDSDGTDITLETYADGIANLIRLRKSFGHLTREDKLKINESFSNIRKEIQ